MVNGSLPYDESHIDGRSLLQHLFILTYQLHKNPREAYRTLTKIICPPQGIVREKRFTPERYRYIESLEYTSLQLMVDQKSFLQVCFRGIQFGHENICLACAKSKISMQ